MKLINLLTKKKGDATSPTNRDHNPMITNIARYAAPIKNGIKKTNAASSTMLKGYRKYLSLAMGLSAIFIGSFGQAVQQTNRLGLYLPAIGSQNYGQLINTNFQIIDSTVNTSGGGGGGGGSTNGIIVASPQFRIPYYSLSGTTNTITGLAGVTTTGNNDLILSTITASSGTIYGQFQAGGKQVLFLDDTGGANPKGVLSYIGPYNSSYVQMVMTNLNSSTNSVTGFDFQDGAGNQLLTINHGGGLFSYGNGSIGGSQGFYDKTNGHFVTLRASSTLASNTIWILPPSDLQGFMVSDGSKNLSLSTSVVFNVNYSSGITLSGSAGTSGQALTSGGPGTVPSWTTISGGGGGVTVYPATATASFPFGASISTIAFTGSGNAQITENGLTGQVVISTAGTGVTPGHCAYFSSSMTLVDAGAACGTGGGGAGGTTGGINNATAPSIPVYSVAGSSNVVSGYAGFTYFNSTGALYVPNDITTSSMTLKSIGGFGGNLSLWNSGNQNNQIGFYTDAGSLVGQINILAGNYFRIVSDDGGFLSMQTNDTERWRWNYTGDFVSTSSGSFNNTVNFSSAVSLGGSYGTAGQVMTSGGGAGTPDSWTTISGGGGSSTSTVLINGVILSSPTTSYNYVPASGQLVTGSAVGNQVNLTFGPDTAVMLSRATDQANTSKSCISTTGNNTYACNVLPSLTAYTTNQCFTVLVDSTNVGAATLNINTLGAFSILNSTGGALTAGAINKNLPFQVCLSSNPENWIMTGGAGGGTTFTPANILNRAIGYAWDGGGSALTTGTTYWMVAPASGTISAVVLTANPSGSVTVGVSSSSAFGFSNAHSICASDCPALSSATSLRDTTLTGWTTAVAKDEIIYFVVNSAVTITQANLTIEYQLVTP